MSVQFLLLPLLVLVLVNCCNILIVWWLVSALQDDLDTTVVVYC